jgi:hypothetical protein
MFKNYLNLIKKIILQIKKIFFKFTSSSLFLFSFLLILAFFNLQTFKNVESRLDIKDNLFYFNSAETPNPGVTLFKKKFLFSSIKSLDLNFNFISKDPTFSYGNLFQTGNTIYALRMEIQPKNKLIVVLPGGSIMSISNAINNGQKYNVRVEYQVNKLLKIYLDGKEVLNLSDSVYTRPSLDFSNIVLGSGLQQKRTFSGVISEFKIQGSYYHISNFSKFILFFSFALGFFYLIRFIHSNRMKMNLLLNFITFPRINFYNKLKADGKIILTSTFVTIGLFLSLIFHYIKTIFFPSISNPLTNSSPISSIFHQPVNIFCDFFSQFDSFMRLGPWKLLLYFPASNLLLGFFTFVSRGNPYRGIAIYSLIAFIFLTFLIYKHFKKIIDIKTFFNVLLVFFLSYPLLFTFHTGNLEIWVFISLLTFFLLYYSKRKSFSAFFLATAISIKLYPVVFIFILLKDRQFSLILKTFFWVFVLTSLPFLIWPTSIDFYQKGLVAGMASYNELMVKGTAGIHFGHSLLNTYRTFFSITNIDELFPIYYFYMVIIFLILTLYASFFEKFVWKRILILVIGLCLLPPTSTDYKLLLFFIPFIYFCAEKKSTNFDILYTILFSLIFINKAYIEFNNDQYTTSNGVLNSFIMSFMLLLILFERRFSQN